MARVFGIALLVLMILAGACGGGGDDSKRNKEPAESEAENELAASLLLTVDDFPTGWAEDTSADEETTALEKECDTGPAPGRTGWAETGDFSRVEAGKGAPVVFALVEDGGPGEARLRAFQDQEFEQQRVVVHRHAPFFIVVAEVGVAPSAPGAAWSCGIRGSHGHMIAAAVPLYPVPVDWQ